jgi:hypothetical protein
LFLTENVFTILIMNKVISISYKIKINVIWWGLTVQGSDFLIFLNVLGHVRKMHLNSFIVLFRAFLESRKKTAKRFPLGIINNLQGQKPKLSLNGIFCRNSFSCFFLLSPIHSRVKVKFRRVSTISRKNVNDLLTLKFC